jgi:hypothetical protein
MEIVGLLPCLQGPTIGPYNEPDECSPHSYTVSLEVQFQNYPVTYYYVSQVVFPLQIFRLKCCIGKRKVHPCA